VQLVSPEACAYEGQAQMVICRTIGGGDIAFLTNHTQFLGALADHPVRVKREDGGEDHIAVHGGFVEVADNRVIILSDRAELAGEIDVERARRAKERADHAIREAGSDEDALRVAEADLRRAEVRIEVATADHGAGTGHH
jgi:F-type H+-transporting ATPase subunit epsilon